MKFLIAAAFAITAIAAPATAVTITFDDVEGFSSVSNGYKGFNWNNFFAIDATMVVSSGYFAGVVSLNNVVANGFPTPATISSAKAFSLTSGYLTAAWNDGLTVQLNGYLGGNPVFTQTFSPTATGPTLYSFNGASIDTAMFSSFGGSHHEGYFGTGTYFGLDSLTINGAGGVPEPASWALMVAGFGLVGASMRRRHSAVVAT